MTETKTEMDTDSKEDQLSKLRMDFDAQSKLRPLVSRRVSEITPGRQGRSKARVYDNIPRLMRSSSADAAARVGEPTFDLYQRYAKIKENKSRTSDIRRNSQRQKKREKRKKKRTSKSLVRKVGSTDSNLTISEKLKIKEQLQDKENKNKKEKKRESKDLTDLIDSALLPLSDEREQDENENENENENEREKEKEKEKTKDNEDRKEEEDKHLIERESETIESSNETNNNNDNGGPSYMIASNITDNNGNNGSILNSNNSNEDEKQSGNSPRELLFTKGNEVITTKTPLLKKDNSPTNSLIVDSDSSHPDSVKVFLDKIVVLPQYYSLFMDKGFNTMKILSHLTNNDLIDIGIDNIEHRRLILKSIQSLDKKRKGDKKVSTTSSLDDTAATKCCVIL